MVVIKHPVVWAARCIISRFGLSQRPVFSWRHKQVNKAAVRSLCRLSWVRVSRVCGIREERGQQGGCSWGLPRCWRAAGRPA